MSASLDSLPVTIIGHPWAPIGMGEQLRSHVQACNAVHLHHQVFDIFRYAQRADPAHDRLLADWSTPQIVIDVAGNRRRRRQLTDTGSWSVDESMHAPHGADQTVADG